MLDIVVTDGVMLSKTDTVFTFIGQTLGMRKHKCRTRNMQGAALESKQQGLFHFHYICWLGTPAFLLLLFLFS